GKRSIDPEAERVGKVIFGMRVETVTAGWDQDAGGLVRRGDCAAILVCRSPQAAGFVRNDSAIRCELHVGERSSGKGGVAESGEGPPFCRQEPDAFTENLVARNRSRALHDARRGAPVAREAGAYPLAVIVFT